MSEIEYVKLNNDLKWFYNSFIKTFPKTPHNKINALLKLSILDKSDLCSKVNYNFTQDGLELVPSIKFQNGDKAVMNINDKNFILNFILNINDKQYVKLIDYSISLDRRTNKISNCKLDVKFEQIGNFVLSLNIKKPIRSSSDYKNIEECDKIIEKRKVSFSNGGSDMENPNYTTKLSYSIKLCKYIDTKEPNTFEFKTHFDLFNTNFKFFNCNIMNFNLNSKTNFKFARNIIGFNYVLKSSVKNTFNPNNKHDQVNLIEENSEIFLREMNNLEFKSDKNDETIVFTAGTTVLNLKLSSFFLGAFINKNKSKNNPVSIKLGLFNHTDPIEKQKELGNCNTYRIVPAMITQINYGRLTSKLKLTLESARFYNEYVLLLKNYLKDYNPFNIWLDINKIIIGFNMNVN